MKASRGQRLFVGLCALLLAAFGGVASADPPARVLRLSLVDGAVSFAPAGSDDWVFATVNRPVVYGDRLWADTDGRSELELGSGTLWMGSQTSLDVLNLDDRTAQFELAQGELVLNVRRLGNAETIEVDTPNLAFVVTRPGRYRLAVDPQGGSTLVAVSDGLADVYGGQASYAVARGQGYRFFGTDLADAERIAPSPPDDVERFALTRDRRYERGASARYVSADVIGVEDLDAYGTWTSVPDYGNVWMPREVPRNWAPYRDGHWAWIDPWGWTWVDDAPWGFAPFHYGRWAYVRSNWYWVPGPANVRPVYAPALVAWFGGGGVSVAVSAGPAIGWFPLGPREVYRPAYSASPQYIREVNISNTRITNVTVINNIINNPTAVTQVNQYVNLRAPNAVTAVPPAALAQSQPVARAALEVRANAITQAQIQPMARVAPTLQAVTGAARVAQAKPPAQAVQRTVVARAAPPPAPMALAERVQLLQKNPGRPIETRQAPAAVPQGRGATSPAPAAGAPATVAAGVRTPPNVRIVSAPKPAATAAPPAKAPEPGRATGRPEPAPPGAPPATAARPGAPGQPTRAQPPREAAGAPGRPAGEAGKGIAPAAQPPREAEKAPPRGPAAAQPGREEPKAPGERAARPGAAPRPPVEAAPAPPPSAARSPQSAAPARAPEAAAPRELSRPAPGGAPRPPEAVAPKAPVRQQARPAPAPQPPREVAPRGPAPGTESPAAAPRPPVESRAAPPPRTPETPRPGPQGRPAPPPQAAHPPEPQARPAPPPARAPEPAARPAPPQPAAKPAAPPPEARAPAPPRAAPARPEQRPPEKSNEKPGEKDRKDNQG